MTEMVGGMKVVLVATVTNDWDGSERGVMEASGDSDQ